MVKLKGPLNSEAATGTLSELLIFLTGKDGPVLKKHARPKNPRTPAQKSTRALITFLSQNWSLLTDSQKTSWKTNNTDPTISAYHLYLKTNATRWSHYLPPHKRFAADPAGPTISAPFGQAHAAVASATFEILQVGGAAPWGYIIYQSQTGPPVISRNTACAFVRKAVGLTTNYRITPLRPGTYYFRFSAFADGGNHKISPITQTVTIT